MDTWKTEPYEIAAVLTGYYQNLFTTSTLENSSNVLEHVPQLITDEMNSYLSHEFLECKVSVALNQMAPLKAESRRNATPFLPTFLGDSGQGCDLFYLILAKHRYLTPPC